MADQSEELKKLKDDLSYLSEAHRRLYMEFSITHQLLVVLAHQCNSPHALRANFAATTEKQRDRLLNSSITDADIDLLKRLYEEVDKQLP